MRKGAHGTDSIGRILNTVATGALVLRQQAINIHNTENFSIIGLSRYESDC